ncbi:MAG: hypothetical protein WDN26_04075 [Chitinophagaceae bacterium]
MASLVIIASNLTNIFLVLVLFFVFIFRTDKLQKSFIVIHLVVLVIFTVKVSPQNNEYIGRFAYKMLGLTYDLPKRSQSPDFIKKNPDSLLTSNEIKKKTALLYIDSISTERVNAGHVNENLLYTKAYLKTVRPIEIPSINLEQRWQLQIK